MKHLIGLIPLLLAASPQVHAAVYCATTSTELQDALDAAANNGQDDVIRVHTGSYSTPTNGFFFSNLGGDDNNITISGGWTDYLSDPCGIQLQSGAAATRLDGGHSSRVLVVMPNVHTDVHVERISFVNGITTAQTGNSPGAGLHIADVAGNLGAVSVERCIFRDNQAYTFGGGLSAGSATGLTLRNNLFVGNQANCRNGAASLTYNGSTPAYLISNTIGFNTVGSDCSGGLTLPAGGLRIGGAGPALLVNNIFWGNTNYDLVLNTAADLVTNDYATLSGTPGPGSSNNLNLDPGFKLPATGDLLLRYDSPLIDQGDEPAGGSPWQLTTHDLDGQLRIQGASVDLGAYEFSDLVFSDGFDKARGG